MLKTSNCYKLTISIKNVIFTRILFQTLQKHMLN